MSKLYTYNSNFIGPLAGICTLSLGLKLHDLAIFEKKLSNAVSRECRKLVLKD
jgi:hypothetical protein